MIELDRYRGPAAALAYLAAAVLAVDLMLTATVGSLGRSLPNGEYPADLSIVKDAGQRLSTALAARRRDGTPDGLAILLGQSTLGCGVDADLLESEDDLPLRWVNLYGQGGSVHKIAEIANVVIYSGAKPEVVAIAINPYMLIGNPYDVIRGLEERNSGNKVKAYVWIWENRLLLNHLAVRFVQEARLGLANAFGVGFEALYAGKGPVPAAPSKTHRTENELRARLEYDRGLGWLEPRMYHVDSSNAVALVSLIRRFRALGTNVVLVVMPGRSMLQKELPREAHACIEAVARESFPNSPLPVIDLQDARIPDDLFLDLDHMDLEGRQVCTRVLAHRIHNLLTQHSTKQPPAAAGAARK